MKVLVIGDSYGLPRYAKNSFNVELDYAGTYPEQLRRMLSANFTEDVCLVNRCRHANTSLSLIKGEANEIEFLRPDYTILQLGLVDLWPAEGRKIWPLYSEQYGRDPWVTPDEYKNNLQLFPLCCGINFSAVFQHSLRLSPLPFCAGKSFFCYSSAAFAMYITVSIQKINACITPENQSK